MKKSLLMALFVSLFLSSAVYAQSEAQVNPEQVNKEALQLLRMARAMGMCDSVKHLLAFQGDNNVAGGNEFIMQFLLSEMQRLGMNEEQFYAACREIEAVYTELETSLSQ